MPDTFDTDRHIGRVLGGFRVEAHIGAGGMGVVYRGIQLSVNRPVAIKFIQSAIGSEAQLKRFRREAEAMARLSHPNSVRLYDFGVTEANEMYLVMELLSGEDLAQKLRKEHALAPRATLHILRQVLSALVEAHGLGIIHRDLKPSNVFLAHAHGDVVAKVMDFGVAGIEQPEANASTKLTHTGAILGTPDYISPEQAHGRRVDARADLYAVGIMLFEMLTGRVPFTADSALGLLIAHATLPVPLLGDVAEHLRAETALQALLDSLLAKDPDARPRDAQSAILAVDAILSDTQLSAAAPRESKPRRSAAARVPAALSSPQLDALPSWRRALTRKRVLGGAILGLSGVLLAAALVDATHKGETAKTHDSEPQIAAPLPRSTPAELSPVAIQVATNIPDAVLHVDDEPWGPLHADKPNTLALVPGTYKLEARAHDRVVAVETVAVRVDEPLQLRLDLAEGADAPVASSDPQVKAPPESAKRQTGATVVQAATAPAVAPEPSRAPAGTSEPKGAPVAAAQPVRPAALQPAPAAAAQPARPTNPQPAQAAVPSQHSAAPAPAEATITTPASSYIIDENTVTDVKTGLRWQRAATAVCSRFRGSAVGCTWAQAVDYCLGREAQSKLGQGRWRLPTLTELKTLVKPFRNPAIDSEAFPNTGSSWYWTSTPYGQGMNAGWLVGFSNGSASSIDRTYMARVRCVSLARQLSFP
jgi:eukaryotic-like serine/threonine-protein kinase